MVPQVREEFESRYLQLHKRLTSLRAESEEVWKTLETAESSLMDMISAKDYDVSVLFAASGDDDTKLPFLSLSKAEAPKSEAVLAKLRADRQETEDFYLSVRPSAHIRPLSVHLLLQSGNIFYVWQHPVQPNLVQSSPVQSNPIQSSPFQSNPVQSSPIQSYSVQSNPVLFNPIQSYSVLFSPIQSNPI